MNGWPTLEYYRTLLAQQCEFELAGCADFSIANCDHCVDVPEDSEFVADGGEKASVGCYERGLWLSFCKLRIDCVARCYQYQYDEQTRDK